MTLAGLDVLIAHISPLKLADRPAYVGNRAYLRLSDGDYPMKPNELRMIEVEKLHAVEATQYDLEPSRGKTQEDLDSELVASYVAAVRKADSRLKERQDHEILRMTNVVTAKGEPTLAGLYALGDYPQGQYPALTVTAAVQLPGGEGRERIRNKEDFTGPLPVLLDGLMEWVEKNLDSVSRYSSGGHMYELPELPLNAVREILANALVHRNLSPHTLGFGKQIQVRLCPDFLLIQSPGGLCGVSLPQLESEEHAQAAVNQRLYAIAKRLNTADGSRIIEGEGGGITEVFRSYKNRGLPRPTLSDTGVQFQAKLWRPKRDATASEHTDEWYFPPVQSAASHTQKVPSTSKPTRNEGKVMRALESAPEGLSLRDLMMDTGLNAGQIRYALSKPLAEDLVYMDGRQGVKATRYILRHP